MKLGSIPESVRIYSQAKTKIKFRWDDIESTDDIACVKAFPSFAVDASNKKTNETAKRWSSYGYYCYATKKQIIPKVPEPVERPNDPITDIRIIGLTIRDKGGRAYQVLVEGKYVFDMREDVLLDTMIYNGIQEGAVLKGEYIFAAVNSEMKLIRVGSLLHAKMIESTEFGKTKAIDKLEVGGIYRNKTGTYMYVGDVYYRHFNQEYNYSSRQYSNTLEDEKKKVLMIELCKYSKLDPTTFKTIEDTKDAFSYYHLNFLASNPKSFKEKIGQIETSKEDIITHLQAMLKKSGTSAYSNFSLTPGYLSEEIQKVMSTR